MLSIIPFFTTPFGLGLQALKQARYEVPLFRVYQNNPDYQSALKKLPGHNIKSEIQPFLEKAGVRKDLIIFEGSNLMLFSCAGTNMFTKGDAAILVPPKFHATDKEGFYWSMKHEISHIKHNDCFTIPLISAICGTAAAVFGVSCMSTLPATFLTVSTGIVVQTLFTRWRESKADDFAIANSSDEELKGGRRVLIAFQKVNLEDRKTFWGKIQHSAHGNTRYDIMHPSFTSRIQKIEAALQTRNISIDLIEENPTIEQTQELLLDTKTKAFNIIADLGGTFQFIIKQTLQQTTPQFCLDVLADSVPSRFRHFFESY